MSVESDELALHHRRRQVIGRLLFRAARGFQEIATQRIRARGYPAYSMGDNAVLVHLEQRGNRVSELARRAGVSKQAISQLVRDLEARGLVHRTRDPSDGRATLVQFTAEGRAMMQDAFDVVFELDQELAATLPDGAMEAMRQHLQQLLVHLDPEGF